MFIRVANNHPSVSMQIITCQGMFVGVVNGTDFTDSKVVRKKNVLSFKLCNN